MNSNFAAVLKVGDDAERVAVVDISMTGCTVVRTSAIDRQQKAIFRIFEKKAEGKFSGFTPIATTIESVGKRKSKEKEIYVVKLKFNGAISVAHGVVQARQSVGEKPPTEEVQQSAPQHVETNLEVDNKSLYVVPCTCYLCGQEKIPFLSLQSRTMSSDINVFGVPQYKEALPGKTFCDYNLLRVNICPSCYFASGNATDFKKESRIAKDVVEPFNADPIKEQWAKGTGERKKLIASSMDGLFSEHRSFEQALLAYDLAVISCDGIMQAEMEKREMSRNYEYARRAAFYMMAKAELLMSKKKREEAYKLLKAAQTRLEVAFPFLKRESSVKAAFTLGMLGLYFEDYKLVGQNLTFLKQYDQNNKIRFGSDEAKTLNSSLKRMDEAYQSRGDFSRKELKGFDKPY